MLQDIDVIAWDFDGVLNRNVVNDRFIWMQQFEEDMGISWNTFAKEMFTEDFDEVLVGRLDLRDLLGRWAEKAAYTGDLDAFLLYWFEKDAHPDFDLLALMRKLSKTHVRQVIATNNGARRTRYIEEQMGYRDRVETVFSSGRMGVAKPSAEFFMHIMGELDVPAHRMLLIDDREENIMSALDMGWRALHFTPNTREQIIKVLGSF
ncbi:HAD-superfamily hydrolase, subfamily IA, variant 3 [Pseudovibrio sp. FO-BEG1]|uniref:HAD family hydrolase n=1 Tax=Pseudovibrio sp. (strain FO-BEG1) TaxID=911045 RepID=UPI000238C59C|nr:HAD-IA family hydrolase [Pseudovibrio sp. FO-BEG1]AEV37270.1 HAD-superfamily hydrolase, subfamily IA, variant 3 [Pseudovibrio sp. FO-BEG1]